MQLLEDNNASLLSALDALAAAVVLLFFLVTITFSTALRVGVTLLFVVFNKLASFASLHIIVSVLFLRAGKDYVEGLDLLRVQRIGERNLENNVKVAEFVRFLVEWQTLANNSLQIVWLDHFTGLVLDSNFCPVQVRYHEVNASECFVQANLLLHKQVRTLALELLVGLLLCNDDDVTGFHAWVLVGFAVEGVLVVVGRALVDDRFQYLFLLGDLLTVASLTLVLIINLLTLATALITRALGLTVHARSEHLHFHDHATALASVALLYSAFLATDTVACCANALSVYSNLGCLA